MPKWLTRFLVSLNGGEAEYGEGRYTDTEIENSRHLTQYVGFDGIPETRHYDISGNTYRAAQKVNESEALNEYPVV